jgi:hypothetical protein
MALWPGWLSLIEERCPLGQIFEPACKNKASFFCGFLEDKICDESATIETLPFFGLLSE